MKRAKADPDGIITARLAGTGGRHASRDPLGVDAAVAELCEIAGDRADLLGEVAGRTLGFGPGVGGEVGPSHVSPRKGLKSSFPITAAGLTGPIRLDPETARGREGGALESWLNPDSVERKPNARAAPDPP